MWSFSLEIHVISFIGNVNVNVNVDGITTERAIFILHCLLNNVFTRNFILNFVEYFHKNENSFEL